MPAIQERPIAQTSPLKTNPKKSIIFNVKLVGFESKNRRVYPPEVLRSAVNLYEGANVNIDHPDRNGMGDRRVGDRIGKIHNARFVEGKGIYGDFHYNPHHQMADQVAWDAEHSPASIGFSHNVSVRVGRVKDGKEIIESILSVRSMDLVADPATTSSLFESFRRSDKGSPMSLAIRQLIVAIINDESIDLKTTLQKLKEALMAQQVINRDDEAEADEESEAEKDRILKEKLSQVGKSLESSQRATDAQLARLVLENMSQPRESLSQLRTHKELLERTIAAHEAKQKPSWQNWTTPKPAQRGPLPDVRRLLRDKG